MKGIACVNVIPTTLPIIHTARVRVSERYSLIQSAQRAGITLPEISIVVPLYNEQDTLRTLHQCLSDVMPNMSVDYEIIYIDDGSCDRTSLILSDLAANDSRVVTARLSRNFGHQAAVTAGLDLATGQAVVVMDGDLQDPPSVIMEMIHRWRQGAQVVYAVRTKRKEGKIRCFGYWTFYRLLKSVSNIDIPLDTGDFCLMDRKVVAAMSQMPERDRFVRGLRAYTGFRQEGITYERAARYGGQSKYTLRKLTALACDGLMNFSSLPIRSILGAGVLFLVLTAISLAATIIDLIANGYSLRLWLLITMLTTLACGVQLTALGVIGEYIRRIFIEVKGRPGYILDTVSDQRHSASPGVGHVCSR